MNEIEPYRPAFDPRSVVVVEPPPVGGQNTDVLDIAGLVAAFLRHIRLFGAIAAGIFVLALLITLHMKPVYVATARVAINTQATNIAPTSVSGTDNAPVVSAIPNDSSAIDTEVAIIGSRRVAERVVSSLKLDQDPEFSAAQKRPGFIGTIAHALFGRTVRSAAATGAPGAAEDYTVNLVLAGLMASRYNLTNAIDISYSDRDPSKAAAISNAFAESYVEDQVIAKADASAQATTFLRARINEMAQQYLSDEAKLQQYKIAHNLMSSGSSTLTEQEISTYNQTLAQAKADAAADEANLRTARAQLANGSTGGDVGEALTSTVIASLRAQRATISAKVADLEGRYGDKYPELLVARSQLADIDQQIQAEINRVISNLEAKADVSRQRLASIEGTLAETKSSLAANNEAQVGLDQLQQNSNASQALYQSYLDRLKETAAQSGAEQADARILSPAPTPTVPSRPVVWLNLMLGAVLGVGCGLVAVFLAEMLDAGLATADDVEHHLGQRYLGSIPLLSSIEGVEGGSPIDHVVTNPHTAFSESFRNLKAAVDYAFSGSSPQIVLISSALPREGKTTTAISLARSTAMRGVRTVIVDCDIRRRGVNQLVARGEDGPGLIEVLTGSATLDEALVVDEPSGALVLPVSQTDLPVKDLIGSQAMANLLDDLRRRFKFIVLDGPPLLPVADARVIATKADALVLVARWRATSAPAIKIALRLLPRDQVRIAGVVLTQVDVKKQSRYGYGDPGYYYPQFKDYYG